MSKCKMCGKVSYDSQVSFAMPEDFCFHCKRDIRRKVGVWTQNKNGDYFRWTQDDADTVAKLKKEVMKTENQNPSAIDIIEKRIEEYRKIMKKGLDDVGTFEGECRIEELESILIEIKDNN